MPDYLDTLAVDTKRTIGEGYYKVESKISSASMSLTDSILKCKRAPIISEIKFASPSSGMIERNIEVEKISREMERGGAVGISVLTEPKHFKGSLRILAEVRSHVKIPILMKDIILRPQQIDAAYNVGANSVLFIETLFDRGYCEESLEEMVKYAHSKGLEVLLETHTEKEFKSALSTDADMVGINNRDLKTLKVDLNTTKGVLERIHARDKIIVSESGIKTPEDIRFLRECGADAFLIGSSIMTANNIKKAVRELVNAI